MTCFQSRRAYALHNLCLGFVSLMLRPGWLTMSNSQRASGHSNNTIQRNFLPSDLSTYIFYAYILRFQKTFAKDEQLMIRPYSRYVN